MSIRTMMTKRFCLSIGAALAVASVLVTHRGEPAADPQGKGIVFVYFPSLCAAAHDARDCHEISRPERPGFESMAACSAYANMELRRESNPRIMASCMQEREG